MQEQIATRRRMQKDATTQIFAGLLKCADCGWSMSYAKKDISLTKGNGGAESPLFAFDPCRGGRDAPALALPGRLRPGRLRLFFS